MTEASALNSTTLIFARWADILRIVLPVVTSQRKTDRSPPEETNLVLSCALEKTQCNKNAWMKETRARDQNRDENLHRDRENLVTVGRISLDHCAQAGVPETDNSVLTTREDIFRASFGVPCDMHGAFVILESGVECTRERLRTSGRCHHCNVPLGCVSSSCLPHLGLPAPFGPKLVISHITLLAAPSSPMAKRSLSPTHLPPAKRSHLSTPSTSTSIPPARSNCFESLYDELILHIFTYLSYTDLCALQTTNRDLARLSLDNQVHSTFIPEILCWVQVEHPGMSCSCGRASTCASLADSA